MQQSIDVKKWMSAFGVCAFGVKKWMSAFGVAFGGFDVKSGCPHLAGRKTPS